MMCIETVQSELAKKLNLFNEAWEKKMWQFGDSQPLYQWQSKAQNEGS